MADTRLAAAGLFLALTLAVVPALLPVNLAGADPGHASLDIASIMPLMLFRSGASTPPPPSEPRINPIASLTAARAYTVGPGDTLTAISQDAGIGVATLAEANHLALDAILHPGQVLTLPPALSSKAGTATTHAVAPTETMNHEVVAGETLWGIAHAFGVRVEALAEANNIALDDVLHPGDALVVPAEGASLLSPGTHRVRVRTPPTPAGVGTPALYETLRDDFGSMLRPSEGRITSRFGWRIHPIFGTREFHTGVDIANRSGTPILAAEDGIVRFAGWKGGYGRLLVLAHPNGFETGYSHLSAILVTVGQQVAKGQIVARMGSTGWSTGPHLFFEVRRNGIALDPTLFLQGAPGVPTRPVTPVPAAGPTVEHPTIDPARSSLEVVPVQSLP
jgi:murein DD-endopeptidase MepM/ murein hydrolase activator NlpD